MFSLGTQYKASTISCVLVADGTIPTLIVFAIDVGVSVQFTVRLPVL